MPLFICSECGRVDNTACTRYAVRTVRDNLPPLCSECDPDIEPHDHFPLLPWDGERDVLNPPGRT